MYVQDTQVSEGPLTFEDMGGCSIGWMRYFPFDAYQATPVTPEAFAAAENRGGVYNGFKYRKAWLASIKVPAQSKMRPALEAAGYGLLATSPAAHDKDTMELWGKGFTVPARENLPARKLRARVQLTRSVHKRAVSAA